MKLAKALHAIKEKGGYTLAQLAEATGLEKDKESFLSRKLNLLKFTSPAVLDAIDEGRLEESTANKIATVRNEQQREALAERAIRDKLTREQVDKLVASLGKKKRAAPAIAKPLRRVVCQLPRESTVAVTCPADIPELTTEVVRDILEFALQEVRKAHHKKATARELAGHFQQLKPKAPKAAAGPAPGTMNGSTAGGHGTTYSVPGPLPAVRDAVATSCPSSP